MAYRIAAQLRHGAETTPETAHDVAGQAGTLYRDRGAAVGAAERLARDYPSHRFTVWVVEACAVRELVTGCYIKFADGEIARVLGVDWFGESSLARLTVSTSDPHVDDTIETTLGALFELASATEVRLALRAQR